MPDTACHKTSGAIRDAATVSLTGTCTPRTRLWFTTGTAVLQFCRHPAVSVKAILQRDLLNQIPQGQIGLAGFVFFIVAIEASSAHPGDLAAAAGLEAFPLHHVLRISP